jgi:carbamoyl-phosphate synthase small subunit
MAETKQAILALEDGTVLKGLAFGASATVVGESVFNTSMTGYQEILTDPSYYGQIVTMTAPQIGNYGINPYDEESEGPKVSGFVVRELSPISSSWRSKEGLSEYLERHGVPGIEKIDTRSLNKKIREAGALKACLTTEDISAEEAIEKAKAWEGIEGFDYVKHVSTGKLYDFQLRPGEAGYFNVEGNNLYHHASKKKRYHVAAFDFGAKRSIFRKLLHYGFDVTVLPANTTAEQVKELNPDGIFLSNGPGDPAPLDYIHKTIAQLLPNYPTFGICLGHQMITHALGAKTYKLKFGHRGGNQPVKNLESGKVKITAQNHGFACTTEELEARGAIVTELNLNDQTVEGLRHKEWPVFSVQYHPEAAPGPNDATDLFEEFYKMVAKHAEG